MKARHLRLVEPYDNTAMLELWRQGFDTLDVARRLGLKEWQVANQLPIVRTANSRSVS